MIISADNNAVGGGINITGFEMNYSQTVSATNYSLTIDPSYIYFFQLRQGLTEGVAKYCIQDGVLNKILEPSGYTAQLNGTTFSITQVPSNCYVNEMHITDYQ